MPDVVPVEHAFPFHVAHFLGKPAACIAFGDGNLAVAAPTGREDPVSLLQASAMQSVHCFYSVVISIAGRCQCPFLALCKHSSGAGC